MSNTFNLFLKTVGLITAGFILGKIFQKKFSGYQKKIVTIILNFLVPVFILTSLWSNNFIGHYGRVMLAALLVLGGATFLAGIFARIFQKHFAAVCLPIIFMNSAYLAIPINTGLFGPEGTTLAIMYSAVVTIIHFTFGIWWVNKEKNFRAFLELPPVYAIGLGLALSVFSQPPVWFKSLVSGLNQFILIVMLMFVGYKAADFSFRQNFIPVAVGVIFRLFGGFLLGYGVIKLLGLSGTAAGVVLITSSMPSAINTYLLNERFEQGPDFAAALILAGLLVSFVFWPVLFLKAVAISLF